MISVAIRPVSAMQLVCQLAGNVKEPLHPALWLIEHVGLMIAIVLLTAVAGLSDDF